MINITKSELLEYHKMMQSKDNNLKNFINLYGNLAFVDSELVQEVRTSQDISNLELDVHTLEQRIEKNRDALLNNFDYQQYINLQKIHLARFYIEIEEKGLRLKKGKRKSVSSSSKKAPLNY